MIYKSNSLKETQNIAKGFSKSLVPGDVICLSGDLGVGKTSFVQGLAQGLHVNAYITSPTFTIVNCYDGTLPLYHFDVYRINDSDEMFEIGYEEFVYGNGISVIEWPSRIADILPEKRYDITVKKDLSVHENYREINIEKRG
ncbi:MAG: tRNA (adenosine(37)-N6)-threonylcarbamoyltransferase complex ATPase subunit type 1 TsaE [Clostridiales bacterium]|nr:tRNA (adenosine(37)-N6)-threonylcarbamoyltransferase complex ATPase subunit type 1 TsaE [Clostridiales bacterium]